MTLIQNLIYQKLHTVQCRHDYYVSLAFVACKMKTDYWWMSAVKTQKRNLNLNYRNFHISFDWIAPCFFIDNLYSNHRLSIKTIFTGVKWVPKWVSIADKVCNFQKKIFFFSTQFEKIVDFVPSKLHYRFIILQIKTGIALKTSALPEEALSSHSRDCAGKAEEGNSDETWPQLENVIY